jgi:hypothetical protein
MEVLAIGNSFSQDALRYLSAIAASDNVELNTANLYAHACSLEQHVVNAASNACCYDYELNGRRAERQVSIREALSAREWDVVTLQQVSNLSVDYGSFQPYLNELAMLVKELCPQAKLMLHQTWAYEQGCERLTKEVDCATPEQMTEDIKACYEAASIALMGAGVIPSGEAFMLAADRGICGLHRDTFHASLGRGRYLLGMVWYATLTGRDILPNTFAELRESEDETLLLELRKCARDTWRKRYGNDAC